MPLNFEVLDPIFNDERYTAGDGRAKAQARARLWDGYLLADQETAKRYAEIPEDQQQKVKDEFYRRADERYREAFTVEMAPARVERRRAGGSPVGAGLPAVEYDEAIPAVRRPLYDQATEDFIAQVKEGGIKPETFGREELLATAPIILQAAPEQLPLWQARAKQVAVEGGLLPADDTWQQTAARNIGLMGGLAAPGVELTKITGMRDLEEGAFKALTPENRSLVALAYPDAQAFSTVGALLGLGGGGYGAGVGLGKVGISLLSKRGIALQAGADALLGLGYRKDAPGLLASAVGKPDDAVLNTVEAGTISGLFGVALRAIDRTYTLAQLRETVGFQGDMKAFRTYLKEQTGKLAPAQDLAPNKRPLGAIEPAEEGARVPDVLPEELQPIAMPGAEAGQEAIAGKAREAASKAADNGPAVERLQQWPTDPEVQALLQSDATADDVAAALAQQEPGQPLPVQIKDGGSVVGGSIPEELPGVRAGDTRRMFSEEEVGFNLAGESQVDQAKATQAAFDRAEEAQKQGKLPDVLPETETPPTKSGASGARPSSDSIPAETAGGGQAGKGTSTIPEDVKPTPGTADYEAKLAAWTKRQKTSKGRGFGIGDAPTGEMDLLSHIEDLGGIGGPPKFAAGEYDGFAETFNRGPARLLRRRGASTVESLMAELAERGFKYETPDQFYQAVQNAVKSRERMRLAIGKETTAAKFNAAFFENAGRPAEQKALKPMASDDLRLNDSFKIRGAPARVTEINPDTNAVKIEGAINQWVEPGTPIYPDKGQVKRARVAKTAGDPFTIEQATLPRRISAPLVAGDTPISLASIREYLGKALDIPVRFGINRRRALGFFRTKEEVIRMKMLNDIPTLAHEVGHYLHKIVFPGGGTGASHDVFSTFAKQFDSELLPLGRNTSRKSYTQQQVRMEGVAEFVREYLTDRTRALTLAPKFTGHLEQTLTTTYPEIAKIVETAREQLGRYINQTPAMKVRAQISRTPAPENLSVRQRLEKFYSDWVTELRPIERHMEQLVHYGLDPKVAHGVSAAATNYVGGWRGKVEHDLFRAQTDLKGNVVGESLRDILRGMDDAARTELGDYLVAKRAVELARRRIKSGISTGDAVATVKLYASKYERTRIKLLGFQHRNLQLLEQAGFVTSDQIKRMRELNADYAPFYRVYETVLSGGRPSGRGFVNTASGVRRIKGSDRLIVDPLESIVRNAYMFRDLAERNMVGRKFIAAVEMTDGGGRTADRVVHRIAPVKIRHDEIVEKLMDAGVPKEVIDEMEEAAPDLGMTIWKAVRTEDPKKGIFKVWKNGKEQFYQADDPELVRSLLLMDSADAELLGRFPFLQNILRPLTRLKRAGATLTPEFIARNPFRDQVQAAVYSKYGFVPFFDGFRGFLSALKKDQYYWDWIKNGGRYSDFVASDRADLVKTLKDVTADPSVMHFIKESANPLNLLNTLQRGSELMEMMTRIGEFRRGIQAGASPLDAANAAKDVSLNFARAGFKGKVWNQLVAFFNARVQDWDKLFRAHRENPARTAAKAFAYITLPSIGAWYLGKDDPAIQGLPDWRKMLFWNINMTDVAEATGMKLDAPLVISLPKPFLLGQLYGGSVEAALNYAYDRDPNAIKKWFAEVFVQSPINPVVFVPDGGLPILENITNYSVFREGPIVNQSLQGLPKQFQATPATSQIARIIGEATNTSPLMIDNAVRGYGAGLGRYGTDSIDWFLLKTNLRDMPTPPAKMLRELPVLRAFAGSPYSSGAQVEQFYRGLDFAERRLRAFSYFGKEISNDSERSWWNKNRNELVYYDQKRGDRTVMTEIRRIQRSLSEINKAMVQVQESRSLSAETKRSTLLELKRQRDATAAAGLKLLHPEDQKAAR